VNKPSQHSRLRSITAFALAVLSLFPAQAQDTVAAATPVIANSVEASLVRAFEELNRQSMSRAMFEIDDVLARNPNFRLGYLIKGDLLMAQSGTPVAFADKQVVAYATASFRHEARVRLERYFDAPPSNYLPRSLLQLAPGQKHVLLVDTEKHRLFVFHNDNGQPRLVADFYVSAGKNGIDKERAGDQKTPLGVYHVTSSIAKQKLTDQYGAGAYPISYPNDWDKLNGREGSGIWLHGTPSDTYSRPPLASDGCVVLTNDDFERLGPYVDIGHTPVVITSKIEWQEPERWKAEKNSFEESVKRWRIDWESLNVERYLSHYSPRFIAEGKDFNAWAGRKRVVTAKKKFVKVGITLLSAYSYKGSNGNEPYMVITYLQDYHSNNLSNKIKKRQYWAREDGHWKIFYEAAAS
jgi:murein L,D-transpeptidase YafK